MNPTWKERTRLYLGVTPAPGVKRNGYLRVTAPSTDSSVPEMVGGLLVLIVLMGCMIYAAVTSDLWFWRIVLALGFLIAVGAVVQRVAQFVKRVRG